MSRRLRASLLAAIGVGLFASLVLPQIAAADPVGYTVAITAPRGTVGGTVTVRAVVTGGVGQPAPQPNPTPKGGIPTPKGGIPSPKGGLPPPRPVAHPAGQPEPYAQSKTSSTGPDTRPRYGAFQIRSSGSWVETERVLMTRVGEGLFEGQLPSDSAPNDRYRLEVRVWGDVPPYNPRDPNTFARAITEIVVDNPPPAPAGVQAASPSPGLRLGWNAVDTAARGDFLGYRVFQRSGRCTDDPSQYTVVGQVADTLFTQRQEPGRYCLRVASVRRSAVSGELVSPLSDGVRVILGRARGAPALAALVTGSTGPPVPPPAPELPEPTRIFSDARFADVLPYDGVVTTVAVPARVQPGPARVVVPGPDPRRGPILVSVGLILLSASFLVRRFLRAPGP